MRVYFLVFISAGILLSGGVFSCAAAASSNELISGAREYNGKTISFEGEIIGDIMLRGASAWVNLNDGSNTIGVFIDAGSVKGLAAGRYNLVGDRVAVQGRFNRSCQLHGGDLDIHADSLTVIKASEVIAEDFPRAKMHAVFALSGVLCLVLMLTAYKRQQKKK